jgi:hypothetical protein
MLTVPPPPALGKPVITDAVAGLAHDVPLRCQAGFMILYVPKTSSMVLTSRVASRPSGGDDHRSCACGSSSS